jgi:exonuclease III
MSEWPATRDEPDGAVQACSHASARVHTRLLAWNILHGGGPRRLPEIALAILAHAPDIVLLSEFREGRGGQVRAILADAGLGHQLVSDHAQGRNAILICSRAPLTRVDDGPQADASRFLHARIRTGIDAMSVVGVHIPDQLEGGRKARFWRHLVTQAPTWAQVPCLMLGDLNTARRGIDTDRDDFRVCACADLMGSFATAGFKDAWLAANPGQREATWSLPPGLRTHPNAENPLENQSRFGSRIDASYASPALQHRIAAVFYDHSPRKSGVSDHSMLILDLAAAAPIGPESFSRAQNHVENGVFEK